ncbi:MAG: hypothetical protein QNJ03_06895 [Dinoroseobacter sp.]|nr:hypothetical protein [Dinoroseobacter sp.]
MSLFDVAQSRTTRRSRVYSGRIKRSILGAGLRHPAIFLHLPKCGGTSLSEALYATVPIHKRVGVIDALSTRRAASVLAFGEDDAWRCHDDLEHGHHTFDLRERILLTHGCWNTDLVHGHVLLTDLLRRHLLGRYKLLTIMREPVARAISNYRMAVAAGIADANPDVWLQSPIARAHCTTYLRYLSGQHSVSADAETEALMRATNALTDFTLIGFLEEIEDFARSFERLFHADLSLHKYNQAKGPEIAFTQSQLDRIHEMCAADAALYASARELQGKRNE